MCKNAAGQISTTMIAIRPTVVSVLTILNVVNSEQGKAALSAFDAAQAALANWTSGSDAADVIQLIDAFTSVFNAVTTSVPIPVEITALIDVISAGLVTVIGLLTANSPAPPVTAEEANAETVGVETPALYQTHVATETQEKVAKLIPGFKVSIWDKGRAALGDHTVVANEYKHHWNQAVEKAGPNYAAFKE
jgi:hypothetical protein